MSDVPELPLAGRCVLITGAARRLGAATARKLHAAGAIVVVHHHRSVAAANELVGQFNAMRAGSGLTVAADLADVEQMPRVIETVLARFGRLDVLINNASSFYA